MQLGTITRTDARGASWSTPIAAPSYPFPLSPHATFHDALQQASDLALKEAWNPITAHFNQAPTIAIMDAGRGALSIGWVDSSIHLYAPRDNARYVHASAAKTAGSTLLALVSRNNWVDLRNVDAADAQRLLRVPLTGTVINH